jgi:predicted transglutaminase-like cysteine proteinase
MHFSSVRAYLRPRMSAGLKRVFSPGAILLAVTLSSASAHAQEGRAQPAVAPSVFGTVAVAFGTTPVSARWTRVMNASIDEPALTRLTAGGRELAPLQKLAFVQSAVNRTVRNRSGARCGTDDGYWAAANETLVRGVGDCIDIAIAKVEALRQLGFQVRDLYLATGRVFTGPFEAALLVRIGEHFYLLDAWSDQIIEAGHATSFTPIVTYGVGISWAHGTPVTSPRTLAKPPAIAQAGDRPDRSRTFSGLDDDVKASIRGLDQQR